MLDLHLKHVLAQAAGAPDLCDLPPDACRGLYRQICTAATVPPADVEVTPHEARFGGQALRVRVYRPRGAAGALPVTLYFHGGGFVLGDLDAYDAVCRQLCADSGVMVVSAAYRLAPEHPYPAAVEDCFAALGWVAEAIRGFGGDPARLAVAGDSAGAALAATTALMARDAGGPAIAFQLLVYPPAAGGHDGAYPSRERHAAGPTLTRRTMDYFSRHYFGPTAKAPDWRGAPLLAPSLAGLPPTLLVLAAHDALRDEAMAYGEALGAAGNAVTVVEYHGLAHGFISMAGAVPAARLALAQMAQALKQALA
ncbi:acetyl esterase [Mitsuaria sp. BK045]|uniref:alpha/beta hydrolase n=1 Tax=unclassified Roseateles TaxID=2626991 RepID=UPI0016200589|nr:MULTISPECIES: alpha/beta hydrolase [unclassified Roseateles]MBB3293325.1 acetyl esterase [Mitsuaria sp. BK041]MBB3362542.1 acetyl esterase [Mitsuaria sp. BK045]